MICDILGLVGMYRVVPLYMSHNNWVNGQIMIQCYVMRTYQVTIYRRPRNESRARFRHWYLVPKARCPLKPLLHMVRPEGFEPPTLWFVAKLIKNKHQ